MVFLEKLAKLRKMQEANNRSMDEIDAATEIDNDKGYLEDGRVKKNKLLKVVLVGFIMTLLVMVLIATALLYGLSKDYMAWSADKSKTEVDLRTLKELADKQRDIINDDLKQYMLIKEKRQEEQENYWKCLEQLNAEISQRKAFLATTEEAKAQLEGMKNVIRELDKKKEAMETELDAGRKQLMQAESQKNLVNSQCTVLVSRKEELQNECDTLLKMQTERKQILSETDQLHAEIQEKMQQADLLQKKIVSLQQEMEGMVDKKLTLADEVSKLTQTKGAMVAEMEKGKLEIAADKKTIEELKNDITQCQELQNALVVSKVQLDVLKKNIMELEGKKAEIDEQLATSRKEVLQLGNQKELMSGQCVDLLARKKTLEQECDALTKAIAERKFALSETDQANTALQEKITQLELARKKIVDLQREVDGILDKKQGLADEISKLTQKMGTIEAEIKAGENEIALGKQKYENLQAEAAQREKLIEATEGLKESLENIRQEEATLHTRNAELTVAIHEQQQKMQNVSVQTELLQKQEISLKASIEKLQKEREELLKQNKDKME